MLKTSLLIFCLSCWSFVAHSKDGDWKNPGWKMVPWFIDNGAIDACPLWTVKSYKQVHKKNYTQEGVGWAFGNFTEPYKRIQILTPAHVIAGADRIELKCQNIVLPAKVLSSSPTWDLAILDFDNELAKSKSQNLVPLFTWGQDEKKVDAQMKAQLSQENYEIYAYFNPNYSHISLEDLIRSQQIAGFQSIDMKSGNTRGVETNFKNGLGNIWGARLETATNSLLYGHNKSLLLQSLAIRPGYSGSPLYIQIPATGTESLTVWGQMVLQMAPHMLRPKYIVGMLTKTEWNGSRSVAISWEDIRKALPYLLLEKEGDLFSLAHPDKPTLVYEEKEIAGSLLRSTHLEIKGWGRLTEYCDANYRESSLWSSSAEQGGEMGGNTWRRDTWQSRDDSAESSASSVVMARAGGDYGDGGGDKKFASQYAREKGTDKKEWYSPIQSGVYRSQDICQEVGLRTQNGHKLDVFWDAIHKKWIKATSIGDIAGLMFQMTEAQRAESLQKITESPSQSALPIYCQQLSKNSKGVMLSYELNEMEAVQVAQKNYEYRRVTGSSKEILTQDPSYNFVQCSNSQQDVVVQMIDFYAKNKANVATYLKAPQSNLADDSRPSGFVFIDGPSQMSLRLRLDASGVNGWIVLGEGSPDCTIAVGPRNSHRLNSWQYSIQDSQVNLILELGTNNRFLSIDVLKLNSRCLRDTQPTWLNEYEFYRKVPYSREVAP